MKKLLLQSITNYTNDEKSNTNSVFDIKKYDDSILDDKTCLEKW